MPGRVQDLVQGVGAGREGPYYDAVKAARRPAGDGMARLQKEILGEMAAALGRAEEHVTSSLARLAELDTRITTLQGDATSGRELEQAVADWNAERVVAERRLWELMVHREALGLTNHAILAELYPLPKRRVTSR